MSRSATGVSQAVRNEEIKLIERVFLFSGQQVPQVVVFCGIDGRGGTAGICARSGRNPAEQTGIPSLLDRCRP